MKQNKTFICTNQQKIIQIHLFPLANGKSHNSTLIIENNRRLTWHFGVQIAPPKSRTPPLTGTYSNNWITERKPIYSLIRLCKRPYLRHKCKTMFYRALWIFSQQWVYSCIILCAIPRGDQYVASALFESRTPWLRHSGGWQLRSALCLFTRLLLRHGGGNLVMGMFCNVIVGVFEIIIDMLSQTALLMHR